MAYGTEHALVGARARPYAHCSSLPDFSVGEKNVYEPPDDLAALRPPPKRCAFLGATFLAATFLPPFFPAGAGRAAPKAMVGDADGARTIERTAMDGGVTNADADEMAAA